MTMVRVASCLGLLGAVCALWAGAQPEGSNPFPSTHLIYTAATDYEPLAWLHGGERFPSGAQLFIFDGKASRPLVPDFFASADTSVSFDGLRVVFAGRQQRFDPWQIWEVRMGGGQPVRLTSCTEDCVSPLYLPEDRIVYAHKLHGGFQIEVVSLKGGDPQPLTYISGNALPVDILRDGRILFEAAYPLGGNSQAELYTVYSDGSGVESYRCDHGNSRHSGRQVSSGDIVFTDNYRLARFTSALAHQVELATPPGEFAGDVAETADGDWILPWRPDASTPFSLGVLNPRSQAVSKLIEESSLNLLQPRPLAPRPTPNRHPSGLHDWDGANVLCLNAYTSKVAFREGAIALVRLYTRTLRGQKILLGASPVEKDGSFFLHVPADQPLQFELIDGEGKTLQKENGWFWMRRGEQRACVGCHAGPERAPENAVPAVLVKSTEPVDLTAPHAAPRKGGY
jgi:hypothetical protein